MLGEEVKVLSLNENGYVQTLPDKNGNLQVKIGILKVNANISDIIRIEKVIDNSKEKISHSKATFIKSDKMYNNKIDVRGYNTCLLYTSIKGSVDKNSLEELKIKYLGKKGEFTSVLRNMANVSKEERPKIGELINLTKQEIENLINEKVEMFNKIELRCV